MPQNLVENIGLFWRSDNVFWGAGGLGNAGALWGVDTQNVTSDAVDFREQHGIRFVC